MQRVNWRPRTYARMAGPGGGVHDPGGGNQGQGRGGGGGPGRGGGRGGGPDQQVGRQNLIAEVNRQARDVRAEVAQKQAFLQMRFDCDSNRKNLGEGNILTFLLNEGNSENSEVEKKDVNKMLRCAGFNVADVLGITKNDFRNNQVEVCFANGVELNIPVIETNLKNNGIDANVSKFDKVEEYLTIYGLPLSSNMDFIKEQIFDSIKAFVKEVIEVTPLCHGDENVDDFFKGKLNGVWRVKVSPRIERQIPNYIVVGERAKAMGKAVYSKAAGNKQEMCSDCFSTGHFKRAPQCEGPVRWEAYCKSFKEHWEMMYRERERELQQEQEEGYNGVRQIQEESRILVLEKSLTSRLVEVERKEKELEEKMVEQEEVHQNLEDMTANVEELERKLESTEKVNSDLKFVLEGLEKEKEENKTLQDRLDQLQKENAILVTKASEDQNLLERSLERIQSSSNITIRPKPTKPQENESMEINVTDEVFDSAVAEETSPPFHGFPTPGKKSLDSSSLCEEPQESAETGLSGTPKRGREGEGPEKRTVKGRTETERHPKIGAKIWMQTLSGKCEYTVESKRNMKQGDFLYTLVNSESRRASFDLKNVPWEYLQENDDVDPLSSSSLDVSKQ